MHVWAGKEVLIDEVVSSATGYVRTSSGFDSAMSSGDLL